MVAPGRPAVPNRSAAVEIGVRNRVLIIDDEPRIRGVLSRRLTGSGYEVLNAAGGEEGLRLATEDPSDLVILDLVMPGLDGMAVLSELVRQHPEQPVIVLSCLTDTVSKVRCLESGANDFVAKPFSFEELLARVRAQLRRSSQPAASRLRVGRISLDLDRQTADSGSGFVPLTKREFLLLRELARRHDTVVSKSELLSSVWGLHFDPGSNVVDVFVGRLRSKLGPELVETVRGEGYRLDGH
jgi:two-component system, OmpR family, response regulator